LEYIAARRTCATGSSAAAAWSTIREARPAAELPVAQGAPRGDVFKSLGRLRGRRCWKEPMRWGRFQLELFSPVAPMLAQTAADRGEALRELKGEVAFEWKMDGARIQVTKGALTCASISAR